VLVRRATIRDLTEVAALRVALLREEAGNPLFARPHPDAERRALRLTRSQLATPGQVLLVATRQDSIVGVLRCRAVRRTPLVKGSRQAVITTAYVVPAERRTGVLRSLLQAADRWCRRRGLSGMRLQCGLDNEVGRRTWESLGFRAAGILYLRGLPT
jgi:GNAT superfamily N-acetyltransferase